jgi:hypothetical protein
MLDQDDPVNLELDGEIIAIEAQNETLTIKLAELERQKAVLLDRAANQKQANDMARNIKAEEERGRRERIEALTRYLQELQSQLSEYQKE